jgi:hypothetical protein
MSIKRCFPTLLLQDKAMPNGSMGTYKKLFKILFPNDEFSSEKLSNLAGAMNKLSENIVKIGEPILENPGEVHFRLSQKKRVGVISSTMICRYNS